MHEAQTTPAAVNTLSPADAALLADSINLNAVQDLLAEVRETLDGTTAEEVALREKLGVKLPKPESQKEGVVMLRVALTIAAQSNRLNGAATSAPDGKVEGGLISAFASHVHEELLTLVARCRANQALIHGATGNGHGGAHEESPFKVKAGVSAKADFGPARPTAITPARDGAYNYRDLSEKTIEEPQPEPIAPEELQRRDAVLEWAKAQHIDAQTYEELIALPAIEHIFRKEVTAVVEQITNGSISFEESKDSPSMVPHFAQPIQGSIPGITQNLRFPQFGDILTIDLIEIGEALLPDFLRTFNPANDFSRLITACLPSRLLEEMRKIYRVSEPTSKEAERMKENNTHARKGRVVKWAKTQGIPINSFDELFSNTRGVSHFWHVAQVATNEAANRFPPPQNGMDYAHYNLVAISALQHALFIYDPEINGEFEEFALGLTLTEIIMSFAAHEKNDQSVLEEVLEQIRAAGIRVKLAGQADRYAQVRDLADSVKLPKTKEELENATSLQKLLYGCSRQERIIVLLHQEQKKPFREVADEIGLRADLVQEIYEAVCAGKKGGNSIPLESREIPVQQQSFDRIIRPFPGMSPAVSAAIKAKEENESAFASIVSALTPAEASRLSSIRTTVVNGIRYAETNTDPEAALIILRVKVKGLLDAYSFPVPPGKEKSKYYTSIARRIMANPTAFFNELARVTSDR